MDDASRPVTTTLDGSAPVAVPIELPRADIVRQARRRRETLVAITRRLSPLLVRRMRGDEIADRHVARAFRRLTDDLGASYTKFGQFVASAAGIFGEDVAAEFTTCLDAGPPVPMARVRSIVERDLGRPLDAMFSSFDPAPIGSASIAVVHRATTRDGRRVAVKVLRPGITHTVATDLVLMRQIFDAIGVVASRQLGVGLKQGLDNFKAQVREELDLRNEAAAMAHFRGLLAELGIDDVVVPEPYLDLSGRRVLTMELLDGVAVHDAAELATLTDDPGALLEQVIKAWFTTTIRSGTFHGDVHAGNLMVLRDGRIAMIDWGIVGVLQPESHEFFRQILRGALGDESALDEVAAVFFEHSAPLLRKIGLTDEQSLAIIKMRARDIFTKPFSEIGFGQFLLAQQQGGIGAAGDLLGATDSTHLVPEKSGWEAASLLRDILRDVDDLPPPPEIDRGLFLLGKQLMFLESYGRTYLGSVAILEDRDFFARLLS